MRLFTALDLPSDTLSTLGELLATLKPEAPIKWSPVENLHITTKFIGEWPESRLDQLDEALQPLRYRNSLYIEIRGLGWFPNPTSPRVFWAGIRGGDALPSLANATDDALVPLGIPRETGPYSPHLTLARVKDRVPLQILHAKVQHLMLDHIADFCAAAFYLYSSTPGPQSSLYKKLRSYHFELPTQTS